MHGLYFNPEISDEARRRGLYGGDLFIYSPTPGSRGLRDLARELAEEAFAPYHPTVAQEHMPVEQYVSILAKLKPRFIHDPRAKDHIRRIFEDVGCDLDKTYFDVPRLRTMTCGGYLESGLGLAFPPHRDTWYGPPYCQIVWWLPVYEIEADNGMAFFPDYWDRPLKNSSGDFDYQQWENDRSLAKLQITEETRELSHPTEPMESEAQFRIVTRPAGMTMFSGAQMHGTVRNLTSLTRLSVDFRTINLDDVLADRGPRNIDDASTGSSLGDYMRASDLRPVPEELIASHQAGRAPAATSNDESQNVSSS